MALRFLDSFDHYTTLSQKWTAVTSVPTIAAGAARTGAQGMEAVRAAGAGRYVTLTLDAQGTWIVGVAFRTNLLPTVNGTLLIRTLDAGTVQGGVRLNTDGTLSLVVGAAVVATSVLAMSTGVYYYVELKHIILNAAGTLEVRVDGAVWATFAGDTQSTANATANQIAVGQVGADCGQGTWHFDDLYILDGTGAAPNNDYQGNTQIEAVVPTGAGFYAEWTTLFGAPTHWQAEDEVPPDEDTSYVESATLNQRDTFAMGNITPVSATINGVQVLMRARTTLAGADNIARLYRAGGVDYQGADIALQTSYNYLREIIELDPNAGPAAWTVAAINAMEMGARVR